MENSWWAREEHVPTYVCIGVAFCERATQKFQIPNGTHESRFHQKARVRRVFPLVSKALMMHSSTSAYCADAPAENL